MNDIELDKVEQLFQETITLEKQFKSVLERQPPYAPDVISLLQRFGLSRLESWN
jgi:hypothetical protein